MTSRSNQAFCTFARVGVAPTPSIVVTTRLPINPTGSRQERTGLPSICTVQAPHSAMPQPNFVPVIPSTSRNTHNSGVSPSISTLCVLPLTLMVKIMVPSLLVSNSLRWKLLVIGSHRRDILIVELVREDKHDVLTVLAIAVDFADPAVLFSSTLQISSWTCIHNLPHYCHAESPAHTELQSAGQGVCA